MKHIKTLTSLVLAMVMALSLSVTALATNIDLLKNAITVTDVKAGATYSLYKMLDLSVDDDQTAYSYTVNEAWEDFFTGDGAGAAYVNIDAQGYVTWKDDKADAASMEAFGKAADKFASDHRLVPLQSIRYSGFGAGVVFGNLDSGYYLITSTVGTKVIVATTPSKPNVTIQEKNEVPTLDKQVKEDSNNQWGDSNDADMGQTVEFRIKVTLPAGSENVVVHDQMSAGLDLNPGSIKIYTDAAMTTELAAGSYAATTDTLNDACTFEISFQQTYLDGLKNATELYVYYTATLNQGAVVGLPGNPNDSWLDYGDENHTQSTPKSETVTYTWDMDVLKYANGNESSVLEGVKFVLLNSDKTKVATVANGKITGWVASGVTADAQGVYTYPNTWPENTILTTNESGKIEIDGLDADTYYLHEVETLPGFNVLGADEKVEIKGAENGAYNTVCIKINNNSGTELPSTGGMGTTIFYALGGVLVLAAVVLLVTRKRMSSKG